MYKVILIDDEQFIIEGLKNFIPWKDYNCEVVATAEDGITGAELIARHRPDILFTDIQMPGQSGLDMLAGVLAQYPRLQVTVLTGYREIEYAQTAIRLGVVRFLLKPSKNSELFEAIEAMIDRLSALPPQKPPGNTNQAQRADSPLNSQIAEEAADLEICDDLGGDVSPAAKAVAARAVDYMKKNYMKKLTINETAEASFVSSSYLSHILKWETGESFISLLHRIRIEKAQQLLDDPRNKIYDVAFEVGFSDATSFARVFKKITGRSAKEYRAGSSKEI